MIDRSFSRSRALFVAFTALWSIVGVDGGAEAQSAANCEFRAGIPAGATVDPLVVAPPGTPVTLHIFWSDPDDAAEGFQLAIAIDDSLTVLGDFTVSGTALDSVGVEFVNASVDNDDATIDGDGRELVVGILLDGFPPFGGQVAGPSSAPFEIGRVSIVAPPTAGACGSVEFVDGLNGSSGPALSNIVVVTGQSLQGFATFGAQICAGGTEFVRSDCNDDGQTDISDMAFLLLFLFQSGLTPHCLEACEVNGDGALDLADPLTIGGYLFEGGPPPPAPFPGCGSASGSPDCDSFDGC